MKRTNILMVFILAAALAAFFAPSISGQTGGGQGKGRRNYDPSTEITIKGTVEEIKHIPGPSGGPRGTHLIVKTDQGKMEVHLGPTSFLEKQQFTFAKGDQVEVTGSKIKVEGADALIAREVKKGGKTLTLRNAQGVPAWSGGRRG